MSASKAALSGYQTPAEEREAREMRSVALAQPHRRGNEDVRAGSPLWEACARLRLRQELYEAGEQYGVVSRAYKVTIAILGGTGQGNAGDVRTEEEEAAQAAKAKNQYWKAVNVLRLAHPMSQGVVERVCYDLRPLSPHEDVPFKKGVYSLAVHFGTLKLGINEDKYTRG